MPAAPEALAEALAPGLPTDLLTVGMPSLLAHYVYFALHFVKNSHN